MTLHVTKAKWSTRSFEAHAAIPDPGGKAGRVGKGARLGGLTIASAFKCTTSVGDFDDATLPLTAQLFLIWLATERWRRDDAGGANAA
ncbi:hypothetical protein I4F81_012037 [Pyropia yezoensis]|uniref:Uncharacterized protein n=1 Tax=Pyropia yezoensis TaxID=2788 RepID=A0ACC3CI64_PYRYE|nr:hypothetical protein I4F81_012037 [Neopyropia yezoensis]